MVIQTHNLRVGSEGCLLSEQQLPLVYDKHTLVSWASIVNFKHTNLKQIVFKWYSSITVIASRGKTTHVCQFYIHKLSNFAHFHLIKWDLNVKYQVHVFNKYP